MAFRFSDCNLVGETLHSQIGEVNSNQAIALSLPVPEHKSLAHYFEQINKVQSSLHQHDVDETDEDFFDFGPEDFDDNPSAAEALYLGLSAWREQRAQISPKSESESSQTPQGVNEVKPNKEEASAPSSSPVGSEA